MELQSSGCLRLQEGKLTKRQVENELSERMEHHRNEVKKFYSDDLEDS